MEAEQFTNISLQYLKQNKELNKNHPAKKSNVFFGKDKSLA